MDDPAVRPCDRDEGNYNQREVSWHEPMAQNRKDRRYWTVRDSLSVEFRGVAVKSDVAVHRSKTWCWTINIYHENSKGHIK